MDAFNDESLLLPGELKVIKRGDIQESMPGSGQTKPLVYTGQGCEAIFSFSGGRVMGNVDCGNESDFVLEPCQNFEGCYVWKEEDFTNMVDHQGDEVSIDMKENQITRTENSEQAFMDRSDSKEGFIEKGRNDNTTIVLLH